jgi:hypothetical protein
MLKISGLELEDQARTLRLDGQVIGPWVEELRGVCERLLSQRQPTNNAKERKSA